MCRWDFKRAHRKSSPGRYKGRKGGTYRLSWYPATLLVVGGMRVRRCRRSWSSRWSSRCARSDNPWSALQEVPRVCSPVSRELSPVQWWKGGQDLVLQGKSQSARAWVRSLLESECLINLQKQEPIYSGFYSWNPCLLHGLCTQHVVSCSRSWKARWDVRYFWSWVEGRFWLRPFVLTSRIDVRVLK